MGRFQVRYITFPAPSRKADRRESGPGGQPREPLGSRKACLWCTLRHALSTPANPGRHQETQGSGTVLCLPTDSQGLSQRGGEEVGTPSCGVEVMTAHLPLSCSLPLKESSAGVPSVATSSFPLVSLLHCSVPWPCTELSGSDDGLAHLPAACHPRRVLPVHLR